MSTGDHRGTATTVNCPLCGLTVMVREPDPVAAVVAAIDALDQHLTDHHQGESQ